MSEKKQLELIRSSVLNPEDEEEAKKLLLLDVYREVLGTYEGIASNGGKLAKLPECVKEYVIGKRKTPCENDMVFSYNAIRVLMARYISRSPSGKLTETPSMVMKRVAEGFKDAVDPKVLLDLLLSRRFVFNSPTLFNMYADGAYGALSACYVTPVYDDMKSIMDSTVVQAMTFKYGGGQGFSFSNLRPRWSLVKGTGSYSSGPLSFMRIHDAVTDSVKQGGKRRGANMGILHVWHPDIINPDFDPLSAYRYLLPEPEKKILKEIRELIKELESEGYEVSDEIKELVEDDKEIPPEEAGFIQAKEKLLGDVFLTNFNISVGVNDAFMRAVVENREWTMINPQVTGITTGDGDYRIHYSVSRETGLGILGEMLEKNKWMRRNPFINIFEEVIEESKEKAVELAKKSGFNLDRKNPYIWRYPARKIWDKIVENAWSSGDPGLLFIDNHNKWSPTPWLGIVVATNPCGEQYLYPFESCNLGSMSIEKYIKDGKFDLDRFFRDVQNVIDAMDAVIDKNKHPDERQTKANLFTRKVGLGVMGLADALVKLGYPYDSDEAVAFTMAVMASLEAFAWKRSWELGKIRGPAPAFKCRIWDWRRMKCIEEGDPAELVELHTPALVKAGNVMRIEDEWVKVKYHDVKIPDEILDNLTGETKHRIERDGTVKLLRTKSLIKVLKEVFGIDENTYREALEMDTNDIVNSPKHLLALAIFSPKKAWETLKKYGGIIGATAPRNTVTTTVAPTGTISIIAGTSSGIEPYFALVYKRKVTVGEFLEVVREFRRRILEFARTYGISKTDLERILNIISENKGSLRWSIEKIIDEVILPTIVVNDGKVRDPVKELEELARLFPTSMDFDVWYHIAHQAVAQLYVDQSISKTVNLPKYSPVNDVFTVYFTAWLVGLKGVTIYRDESKTKQVIYFGLAKKSGKLLKKKNMNTPGDGDGNGRRIYRLAIPKRVMTIEEVKKDPFLLSLARTTEDNKVVVELTENSTCKTCEL
jgi:ribonucleoside-diphosphate reductase alpha chain